MYMALKVVGHNRCIDNPHVLLICTKKQVAEWMEIAEIESPMLDSFVVRASQVFGSAQGVVDGCPSSREKTTLNLVRVALRG